MTESLSTLDFINGLFSLLVISIAAIIGLTIALKYLKFKRKLYLYWGIAYIGFYSPWWSSAFSFVSYWFTGNPLPLPLYIGVGILLLPLLITLWFLGFTEMIYQNRRRLLILIYLIITISFDLYVIYFLIDNATVLGNKTGIFDIKYSLIVTAYFMLINITVTITGLLFAKQSFKSEEKELRFKGKALIVAFLTYPICGIFDAGLDLNEIWLIVIRSLLMFGAIMFYIGFFIPKFVKKIFNLD